jgi:hypothetical protein
MDREAETSALPELLRSLFWDYEFDSLTWDDHRDLVIGRVLAEGSWQAVCWLRSELGDGLLREWIEDHRGRSLSLPQLRFWQLILDLPKELVDEWMRSETRQIWDKRTGP